MSAFTNLAEDDFLDLFFTNVNFPNVGDATGLVASTTAGSLFASLHTGSVISDTSTLQTDTEVAYTGYARQGIARSTSGWTVTSGTVSNDALIQFGEMTAGGPDTVTDLGLGSVVSGAGVLQIWGALTASLVINNGINPQFAIAALDVSIN